MVAAPPSAQAPRLGALIAAVALFWAGMLVFRAIPLGGTWEPISLVTWLVILLWWLALIIGMILGQFGKVRQYKTLQISAGKFTPSIWVLCFFSTLAAVLMVYEYAVVRDYGLSVSTAEIRLAEVARVNQGVVSDSTFGALGRSMQPSLLAAWCLAGLVSLSKLGLKTKVALYLATFLLLFQIIFFEGGRLFLVALVVIYLIASYASPNSKARRAFVKGRSVIGGLFLFVVFFPFFNRLQQLGIDLETGYRNQVSLHQIEVPSLFYDRLEESYGIILFLLSMIWLYLTQSLGQINLIIQNYDFITFQYGYYQFPQVAHLVSRFTGRSVVPTAEETLNPGIYDGLIGASIVDFGIFGSFVFALFLGVLFSFFYRKLQHYKTHVTGILFPIFATILFFSPFISIIPVIWPALYWLIFVGLIAKLRFP